jgi:hypothetical protein
MQFRHTGTPGPQVSADRRAASTLVKAAAEVAAAPAGMPETPAPEDWVGKAPEPGLNKNISDEDVVTFMTTEQQTIMALKTAQTEVMTAVMSSTVCTYRTHLIRLLL